MIPSLSQRLLSIKRHKLSVCGVTTSARSSSVRRCASTGGTAPPPPPRPPTQLQQPGGSGDGAGNGPPALGTSQLWLRVLQIGAGALAVSGLAAAALPAVLATQWGLQNAMELINTRMPAGRLEVAEARLSWLGGNELQCVKVYDSPRGGTILMHLNRVSTSASLWRLITGSDFNLVIAKPWINTVYDARISDFKLINLFEKVGLLSAAPPPPQPPAQTPSPAIGNQQQEPPQQPSSAEQPQPQQSARQPQAQQQQPGRVVEVLSRINAKMDINADVRLGRVNLVVTDGMLLVADEIRQILGPRIHVTGAVGDRELREWAEEVGEDVAWADRAASAASRVGTGVGSAAAAAAALPPGSSAPGVVGVMPPPAEVLRRPGAYRPGILQVHSDHLTGEMRVWEADDHTLLHQPATARLELTPALSRFGLASANPLLGNVVEVRGGDRLAVTFTPQGGRLPYQEASVEMAPAVLSLGPSSLVVNLLSELGLKQVSQPAARTAPSPHPAYATSSSSPPSSTSSTSPSTSSVPAGALTASLSVMRVHFSRSGTLRTDRVDMRLGGTAGGAESPPPLKAPAESAGAAGSEAMAEPGAGRGAADGGSGGSSQASREGGVHVALWGGADLRTDTVDFTLGVAPGQLLDVVGPGAEGLPAGYLLLVPLRGPTSAPRYDVGTALKRLGKLSARQWAERRQQRRETGEGPLGLLLDVVSGGHVIKEWDREMREDMALIPPPPSPPPA